MLGYLKTLATQAPAPTAQLDRMMRELRAKRALIGALALQLDAFDQQLAALEDSMRPLHEWSQQWTGVQQALVDAFRSSPDNSSPDNSSPDSEPS